MRRQVASFGSLLFMFSFYVIAVSLLAYFLSTQFLWILLGVEILSIFFAFYVMINKKRRMETRIRWSIFIVFFPILGIGSYVYFGRMYHYDTVKDYKYKNFSDFGNKTKDQMFDHVLPVMNEDIPEYKRAFMMGLNEQSDLIYKNTSVSFLPNGTDAWVSIFNDISSAKNYILINLYIIEDGELCRNFVQALKNKIEEGVRVYIIYDFAGSYAKFDLKVQKELKMMGAHLVPFSPIVMPFVDWKANYRDHRKDFSIDGRIGYTGGINLSDEYINMSKKYGYWNDSMVRVVGEAVQGIEKIFASDWKFIKKGKEKITDWEPEVGKLHPKKNNNKDLIQIVSSGPNHASPLHLDLLLNLIGSAQKRIWLSTPYFVPPIELIKAISSAAKSGIDVRLVLPGMSDKFMLLDVSKKWTDELYESGVKVYSMNNIFNHTKAFLFDDEICFTGTTNMDFRALFTDQQTMLLVKSKEFNSQLENRFIDDFKTSFLYNFKPSREHKWFTRLIVNIYNIISPLL
ncbi:cardiolipin synthetase [Williamsoniiplasma somnilux]|uniref:Cardiolipin synthase n=1 Tax=Williamsoniiplasma somnilux TaxID=215578 RepID=A0A2K8P0S0_9MOLU|nr:cardiolipin synthase [Williamsoniiplasma somnilux]ATZ18493.1 cardiolipin synthetase [Williamsoniiplasma somnilux]